MKVKGKTIVVTGAGSGMGRELTLLLLSKDATVIGVDIHTAALQETVSLAQENSSRIKTYTADISKKSSVEELYAKIIADCRFVDGLINNAGIIQPFVKLNDLSYDAIERVFNVNLYGTLYMTKTFLPHLLTRPEAHVANISSMGGFLPVPGQTVYGASKAAVKLLTEGLHAELSNTNVRVTTVFPGAIDTNITANSGVKIPEMPESKSSSSIKPLNAGKAAEIIVNAIERNAYRVMVGNDARVMDFLYRFNPKSAAAFITKKMKDLLH